MSDREAGERPAPAAVGRADASIRMARSEAKIRDAELYRMAAFRIRESANRIVVLGNGAENPDVQRELTAVYERLLDEERALLALAGTS